ncbi:hypothetical protein G7A66_05840 [Altererythrobacter sp. SALINAS58]|uniref:hypothetical protein n=1 Tax=Alteripontixanthobacter muriae TaxID=2705546 RepID=UPI0015752E62|nr:hypothetical protein [Alteripontixanthobacter muriae]NTZ42613.1 hypothetical protein [Alteripontixanthobacter muriae]
MSQTYEFYSERAQESAKQASEATLDNVRERALRSEAVWLDLAHRARQVARDRRVADEERAARRAAEQEDATA